MIYGYGLRVSTGSTSDLHVNIPGFGTVVATVSRRNDRRHRLTAKSDQFGRQIGLTITYSKEFTFMVGSSRLGRALSRLGGNQFPITWMTGICRQSIGGAGQFTALKEQKRDQNDDIPVF